MAKYDISGTFYNCPVSAVEGALRAAMGKVETKSRQFGYHIDHQSDGLALHVQAADNNGAVWYMNGEFSGTSADLQRLLHRLTTCLIDEDIIYLIDRTELDENDEPVADEERLCHPEFDKRYVPPE